MTRASTTYRGASHQGYAARLRLWRPVVRASALVLLASAVLKLDSPFTAAVALEGIGGWGTKLAAVHAAALVELALGLMLVVAPLRRDLLVAGVVFCLLLVAGRYWFVSTGMGGDCGCFGRVRVSSGVSLALLLVLASVFSVVAFEVRDSPNSRRARLTIMLIVVACFAGGVGSAALRHDAARDAVAGVSLLSPGQDAWIVVGSWDCEHCMAALERLSQPTSAPNRPVVRFLVPTSGRGRKPQFQALVHEVLLSEENWWDCVDGTPPRIWRWAGGELKQIEGLASVVTRAQ